MKEFKTPKLIIEEKDQLLLADENEEGFFDKLLETYCGLIKTRAKNLRDPREFIDLDEKIHVGTIGLLMAKRKYKQRQEPNPDAAVSINVINQIRRTITGGRKRIPDEEIGMTSLDKLTGKEENKDNYPLLEVLNVGDRPRCLEEEVCSQVSLGQLLEAVGGLIPKVIDRNLDIFSLRLQGLRFEEIGARHELTRQGAWRIFNEVKKVALGDSKVVGHLSEITGLSINEINRRVAAG